jgi:hypothetical protein
MMKSVVDAQLISLRQFREWPVFQTIRSDARFIEAFEKEFGEKLIADKALSNLPTPTEEESAAADSDEPESRLAAAEPSILH